MSNVTTLAALREPQPQPMANIQAGFFNLQSFELMQRVAKGFASSTLVPKEYQGNIANCMIGLSMAQRIGADPLMVLQNLYIVHGRPSWSSKFLIATFNACGRFTAMRFDFSGTEGTDDWACQAHAIEKATGQEIRGTKVSIAMAKKEGWYTRNGSKWQTMPQQMLMYRAASFMVSLYAPELSMGLGTVEESHDIIDVARDTDGSYSVTVESMRETSTAPATPPEKSDWPQANPETGELLDIRGIPWIDGIHSSGKTCNADGTWRRQKGISQEVAAAREVAVMRTPEEQEAPPTESGSNLTFDSVMRGIEMADTKDQIDEWLDLSRGLDLYPEGRATLHKAATERLEVIGA